MSSHGKSIVTAGLSVALAASIVACSSPQVQPQTEPQVQEQQAQEVDKSNLNALIQQCGFVSGDGYTADSYGSFSQALEQAKATYDDDSATQDEVDDAYRTLNDARSKLVEEFNPDNYADITYEDMARTPDAHIGAQVKISGKVMQVIESGGETDIRIATDGMYDDDIFVGFDTSIMDGTHVLEDDNVVVYGTFVGPFTYQTTFGASRTVPAIIADEVEVN